MDFKTSFEELDFDFFILLKGVISNLNFFEISFGVNPVSNSYYGSLVLNYCSYLSKFLEEENKIVLGSFSEFFIDVNYESI